MEAIKTFCNEHNINWPAYGFEAMYRECKVLDDMSKKNQATWR
jgi:hypothetical protein